MGAETYRSRSYWGQFRATPVMLNVAKPTEVPTSPSGERQILCRQCSAG